MDLLWSIGFGAVAGFGYALTGYIKNAGQEPNVLKMAVNAIAGGVIGGALALYGIGVDESTVLGYVAMSAGTLAIVEQTLKGVWKRISGKTETKWV